MNRYDVKRAANIVRDAGGRVIGRTRLQKIAFLLTVTGLEKGLSFTYKHFGPYSEDLAIAVRHADLLGLLEEEEKEASWGGLYSVYVYTEQSDPNVESERLKLAQQAANADAIELELAATALFLAKEGYDSPWAETERRKPEKSAHGKLDRAKVLYEKFRATETPCAWPAING